jgi:hypothetical protein
MRNNEEYHGWKKVKTDIFWGEIAPTNHVLQIYETDEVFINSLAGFVGGGINANDACIVIATDKHLKALETRLEDYGVHVNTLISEGRYLPFRAEETLSKFMVDGWPDESLFMNTISGVIKEARGKYKRGIRAFGEMVAILWAQGNNGATVQLEHLWNEFCQKEAFSLFCAYPKTGFTVNMSESIEHICCAHSKIINGSETNLTEVFYKETYTSQTIKSF